MNYTICGMGFGDEGKGSHIDWLTHKENIKHIIRYNGGSQASHTVIDSTTGVLHKFSQLGSGMFHKDVHTVLSKNMVINIENLIYEAEILANKLDVTAQDILDRVVIHPDCYIVTQYHKLINKLRELSLGENCRGSVGTGVSEVPLLRNVGIGLQVCDINSSRIVFKMKELKRYAMGMFGDKISVILKNSQSHIIEKLYPDIIALFADNSVDVQINAHRNIFNKYKLTFSSNETVYDSAIYEGSQGLLLDDIYGIKPNTTYLDTTNRYADILIGHKASKKIGISKAFFSRHGKGVFPTEDIIMHQYINDANQEHTFWNGGIRFGWFDVVLTQYANTINDVDELWLSAVDQLSSFEYINVCVGYTYTGEIDKDFEKVFKYIDEGEGICVTGIKTTHPSMSKYIQQFKPVYVRVNGWKCNIHHCKLKEELPAECVHYVTLLQNLIGVPITCISVGPTREDKIEM